jgi:hypothetical protein
MRKVGGRVMMGCSNRSCGNNGGGGGDNMTRKKPDAGQGGQKTGRLLCNEMTVLLAQSVTSLEQNPASRSVSANYNVGC